MNGISVCSTVHFPISTPHIPVLIILQHDSYIPRKSHCTCCVGVQEIGYFFLGRLDSLVPLVALGRFSFFDSFSFLANFPGAP